ncbi:MAG TPA: DUF2127 domain-containing protein [Candidatus Saccharimonadales bacterium]|nr:DUF2127 domain-containing protein [Candidatus Saccharimonadales bacterium]
MPSRTTLIDDSFFVAVIGKCAGGVVELAIGILLIFLSVHTLQALLTPLQHVGVNLVNSISSGSRLFIIVYFSLRGSVRLVLGVMLLREQLWAYPAAVLLLLAGHYSSALLALTLFDTIVVGLTWYEYFKLRRGHHLTSPHL